MPQHYQPANEELLNPFFKHEQTANSSISEFFLKTPSRFSCLDNRTNRSNPSPSCLVQCVDFQSEGINIQSQRSEVKMNRRRHHRIEVQNVVANLSNGVDFFLGTVNDVSRVGMLLADIPKELHGPGELSIIVSAKEKDYKMLVEPRWISENSSDKRMGLVIVDVPLDWTVFVMNCEPTEEDIWAETTHLPDC